jgi:hypothetical protein
MDALLIFRFFILFLNILSQASDSTVLNIGFEDKTKNKTVQF